MKSWKPWLGALLLLALAGWWWTRRVHETTPTRGWPARWNLSVVDRATGHPVPDAVWTLLATREGRFDEGIGQGVAPAAPSPALLAQARRVAVGAYGYEVRILEPDGLDELGGRIDLEPAADTALLSLASDDEAVTTGRVTLMISLRDPDAPLSAAPVWWLHRDLALTRTALPVPVGRGHLVQAVAMLGGDEHVRWPVPAAVQAGRPTVVHMERTRRVAFTATGRPRQAPAHLGWLHIDPRRVGELGGDRRSGLALHTGQGGYEAAPTTGGLVFEHLPRVPLTGVVHTAEGWFAVELDAESTALPLTVDGAPVRRLSSISIDGEPPPEGAVVVPGTVCDDLVNAILARGWLELDALGLRTPKPDAWHERTLPAAKSLTVWHRDRGLARLRWTESGVALGTWEPGSVHLRRPPDGRVRAAVSVRSGCVGSPLVSSGSSRIDGMERPFGTKTASLLRGIPLGPVALELRTWRAGQEEPTVLRRQVVLDEESPCARFSMAEDGSLSFEGTGTAPRDER